MEFHVAAELQLKARRPKSVDMVLGVVDGLKNGELVMAGVVGGVKFGYQVGLSQDLEIRPTWQPWKCLKSG